VAQLLDQPDPNDPDVLGADRPLNGDGVDVRRRLFAVLGYVDRERRAAGRFILVVSWDGVGSGHVLPFNRTETNGGSLSLHSEVEESGWRREQNRSWIWNGYFGSELSLLLAMKADCFELKLKWNFVSWNLELSLGTREDGRRSLE